MTITNLLICIAAAVAAVSIWHATRNRPELRRWIFGAALGAAVLELIRAAIKPRSNDDEKKEQQPPQPPTRSEPPRRLPRADPFKDVRAELEREEEEVDSLDGDDLRDAVREFNERAERGDPL